MATQKRSLEKYKQKRNFAESPEPSGSGKQRVASGKKLFFCVQKHLASHLHYDFRLEHKGVLLSWAVPKGPSLNPKDKRLAMAVEDHPLDYGDFEGVIPSGYGAGIVMLWDRGTWVPEIDDIDAALKKGELKFSLDGVKLKGSWALIRTQGFSSRSWLLIKHRDEWAGDVDITTQAPDSVKSFQDFPHILAADKPAIWESHEPNRGGAAGKMLKEIIEQAAELKAGQATQAAARPAAKKKAKARSGKSSAKSRGSTD